MNINIKDKLLRIAKEYSATGLSVIPVHKNKKPDLPKKINEGKWAQFQAQRPSESEIEILFNRVSVSGIAVICGNVSGGLEVIDFDDHGSRFAAWKEKIPLQLYNRLTVERSPSGGYHVYYRCTEIGRDGKLATTVDKKVLIETRAEGGYIVCAPTPGYELIQGNLHNIPEIAPFERQTLIEAAEGFDETPPPSPSKPKPKPKPDRGEFAGESPAEAYNRSGDVRTLLEKHGWQYEYTAADGNEHWTRPGKECGTSATLKELDGRVPILNNFSTNAGLETDKGYSPFQLYAELEHGGDQSVAAKELLRLGYGSKSRQINTGSCNKVDNNVVPSNDPASISLDRQLDSWTPFPLDCLPKRVRRFVVSAAKAINFDPAGVAISLLATAGATIGARLKVRLPGVNRSAAPILWVALVGSSASGKTPTMYKPGLELLKKKKYEFRTQYESEKKEYQNQLERFDFVKNRIKAIDKLLIEAEIENVQTIQIKKGKKTETRTVDDLKKEKEKYEQMDLYKNPPSPPVERIIDISGAFTLPGLVDKASKNPLGFMIFQDELTQLFKSLEDNSQIGASGELLSFFDGSESRTALKDAERNRSASSCWAAILGGIVPDNLRRYIAGTERQTDGFLSRFLLVFPPPVSMEEYNEKGLLDEQSDDYKSMKEILERLADYKGNLGTTADGNEIEQSRFAMLSEEAQEAFYRARRRLRKQYMSSTSEIERSLIGKAENYLTRLTLLLFILESAEHTLYDADANAPFGLEVYTETTPISLDTYKRAEQLTNWLVNETRAVYKNNGFVKASMPEKIITVLKDAGKPLTSNEIGQKINLKGAHHKEERERLLNNLIENRLVHAEERLCKENGKSSLYYSIMK